MSFLEHISGTGYEILIALVSANFIAQIFKTVVYAIRNKSLDLTLLFTTGGMPSSHSAAVMAMTTSVGLIEGFSSSLFAISFCFSSVVMYDAAGVRRAAGRQAKTLNEIIQELMGPEHHLSQAKLKEFLGHTPKEVIAGALLGIVLSVVLRYCLSL